MLRAVIDLGTNSLKCLIGRVEDSTSIISDRTYPTRLGAELARTGCIGNLAMERNLQTLRQIGQLCAELQVREIICVGAQTLRQASDAAIFRYKVKQSLAWQIIILTPEEEALLAYRAASSLAPSAEDCLVIDSGGGSTEFTFGRGHAIHSSHSLPLGAVLLTQSCIHSDPVSPEDYHRLIEQIRHELQAAFPSPEPITVIGCGGGITTIAAVSLELSSYSAERVHGSHLQAMELDRQLALYRRMDLAARKLIPGMDPSRADIILASASIIRQIMQHFQAEQIRVSVRGLRHALLEDSALFAQYLRQSKIAVDMIPHSTKMRS